MKKSVLTISAVTIMLSVLTFIYSCEKREPAFQPSPGEIMKKITENFAGDDEININRVSYESGDKSKELSEKAAAEIYSNDGKTPADISKIEKYSIITANENFAAEIGIFKLYDKINADYIKEMTQVRILKMQDNAKSGSDIYLSKTVNNAESRSYGNYVYYVSHPEKDKIFEIIENSLRGE